MRSAITASWALFLGIALLMLGNGLQGTLLGLRATLEGFPTLVTGLVMSGYYTGFLAGSTVTPMLVKRVGHIRVFAALASLASTSALIHAVFLEPIVWIAMRLLTGFCFAGLYVVAESWLNNMADNTTRGQLLSVYMVIVFGSIACGQFLLNLADPGSFELFILISVLVSFALVPISLTPHPMPDFTTPANLSLKRLYKISPLGVIGSLGVGTAQGALFGMGAVYAKSIGLSLGEIAWFMAIIVIGGVVFQWPAGHLSDKFDRRRIITLITFSAAAIACVIVFLPTTSSWVLFPLVCLFGGLCLPLYSLCIAHTNDYLEPEQMVAASSSLVLIGGIGSSVGPLMVSALMSGIGPAGFFWFLAAIQASIGVFAIWRMGIRKAKPLEEQGHYAAIPFRTSPVVAAMASQAFEDEKEHDA